jgi:Holliday junction resolvase RusA-like endonuclease
MIPPAWSAAFEIPAEPRSKPRHRSRVVTPRNGHPYVSTYPDPQGEKDELTVVALAAARAPPEPWAGPVELALTFRMPVPVSRPRWSHEASLAGALSPTGKPDLDNLVKLLKDALTRSGRWWRDDAQVVRCDARKVYAATPGTLIEVRFLREMTCEEWRTAPRTPCGHPLSAVEGDPEGTRYCGDCARAARAMPLFGGGA